MSVTAMHLGVMNHHLSSTEQNQLMTFRLVLHWVHIQNSEMGNIKHIFNSEMQTIPIKSYTLLSLDHSHGR